MEWLVLIVPIFAAVLLLVFFKHKTQWWEPLPALGLGLILILSFKGCSEWSLTHDTEYHNGYITEAWYYEDWSEWISRTCTNCTSDGNGNQNCYTYDCSYEDYNPEYWLVKNNIGDSWKVSKAEYQRLVKLFGNQSYVDMRRPYCCGNDGDAYVTKFPGDYERLIHTSREKTYKNKIQASNSVFKFSEVTKAEADSLGIYDYPPIIKPYHQDHLIGIKNPKVEKRLDYLNATLGNSKEVKVFLLVFKGKPETIAELQENYWKGGNKNEYNVMIGLDATNNLQWAKVMSWTEQQELKILTRNYLLQQKGKPVDLMKFTEFLEQEISDKYIRKKFSDFDYLEIEMTSTQKNWLWFVVILVTIAVSVFAVMNDFDNPEFYKKSKNHKWY